MDYPRASFHYDVMVTLILLIIFVTPHFINYKDKPAERQPRPKSVLVMPDGNNGLIFRVDARDVKGGRRHETQADLQRVIEPISGYVKIKRWAPDRTAKATSWDIMSGSGASNRSAGAAFEKRIQ